jgi:hypothetical protein
VKPWLAKFRLVLHSKKFSVLRAAPISLVGQAIRLSPPAGAGALVAAMLLCDPMKALQRVLS